MNIWITYLIITAILVAAELLYFRIADRCNIIDRPNERSSHSKVVIRGGGIIFIVALWVWTLFFGTDPSLPVSGPLSVEDWQALEELANEHGLLG